MHIVKRKGHLERWDERKVYASSYAACMSCHMAKKDCKRISSGVTKDVTAWIKGRKTVRSDAIFRQVVRSLKKRHADAAFMYETHRDLS